MPASSTAPAGERTHPRSLGRPGPNRPRLSWPGTVLRVPPAGRAAPPSRRGLFTETWLVLGVSLGASAVWSALSLLRTFLTARAQHTSVSAQTSTLNTSRTNLAWLDIVHQLVGIALALVPVALTLHLLGRELRRPASLLGLDGSRRGPDAALGAILAAVIGIPGLGLYVAAKALGVNTTVVASGLGEHWWVVPVLVLAAAQNALLEEIVMVGYLFTRWSQAGWGHTQVVVVSALVRGSYHLYQGLGGFVGNVVMGLVFGWVFTRTRRVMPLVVAHTILDVVSFVGYTYLTGHVSWL